MKTKEEVIQEAWTDAVGVERYEYLKEELIFDGFLHFQPTSLKSVDTKIIDGCPFYRPKSLSGIENNNGWIRVESEEDLKLERGYYWFKWNSVTGEENIQISLVDNRGINLYQEPTHYRPIVKPKPPLY